MTTSLEVQTTWYNLVLNTSAVKALYSIFFAHSINFASEFETARLRDSENKINYVVYTTSRSQVFQISNLATQRFDVRIEYTREIRLSTESEDNQAFQLTLETIEDQAVTQLNKTWSGLVDYWTTSGSPTSIERVQIDNIQCLRATLIYTGFKHVSLA